MARRRKTHDDDAPVFVISVAAELAGMHAQTLRQYDRLGLVVPGRTRGGGRRYSARDIERLREVQTLSQEQGVSLAGIRRIMELEKQVDALRARIAELDSKNDALADALQQATGERTRVFAAGPSGEVVVVRRGSRPRTASISTSLVVWRPPAD